MLGFLASRRVLWCDIIDWRYWPWYVKALHILGIAALAIVASIVDIDI